MIISIGLEIMMYNEIDNSFLLTFAIKSAFEFCYFIYFKNAFVTFNNQGFGNIGVSKLQTYIIKHFKAIH
jgi:hypothetical protein